MKLASFEAVSNKRFLETLTSYYELTKPGITFMVLGSMLMGFILGSATGINYWILIHALIGTYAMAAGTAAHNQFIERHLDRLMNRTRKRPLPASRITPQQASRFSYGLMFFGLIYLVAMVNWKAGLVSAMTTLIYLAAYTPMKRVSAINILIGAIPGALPPVGGWVAASGSFSHPGMWLLFGIVFFWQIPHVMSIAWVCNDDYCKAGFSMLPKNDGSGLKTAWYMLLNLVALVPVIYALYYIGLGSWIYLSLSGLATLVFTYYGFVFLNERNKKNAKYVMFSSFIYLPIVWIALFADILIFNYLI